MSKRVIIPIETKVRELEGKLWLALHLLSKGHEVILGHKPGIMISIFDLKPDVFIDVGPGGRSERLQIFRKLKENDTTNIILDQEGGILPRTSGGYQTRVSQDLMEFVDYFLTWGPKQADIVSDFTDLSENQIVSTGEPKNDLLHSDNREFFSDKVNEYQSEFGDYILVNTSFALANNVDPKDYEEILTGDSVLREEDAGSWLELDTFQKKLMDDFTEGIRELSESYPETNFVIRPHPSEDFDTYIDIFRSFRNIHVKHEGGVYPWVLGSELVIHNNCTTAVESVLLNKPVVGFNPRSDEEYYIELPNKVSRIAENYDELFNFVEKAINGEIEKPSNYMDSDAKNLLYNFFRKPDGKNAQRICDLIDRSAPEMKVNYDSSIELSWKLRFKNFLFGLLGEKYYLEFIKLKNYLMGISSGGDALSQKFPGITKDEINSILASMNEETSFNHKINFETRKIRNCNNIFSIKPT